MKKQLHILLMILCTTVIQAQVLFNETFDNLILGNLSNDTTGASPGQNNWYAACAGSGQAIITQEPNKGKVLTLSSNMTPAGVNAIVRREGIDVLVNQRTAGNNVIKWEFDYYTGVQHNQSNAVYKIGLTIDNKQVNNFNSLVQFSYDPDVGYFSASYLDGKKQAGIKLSNNPHADMLPFNTWIKIITYLDYANKKIYFEIPYYNKIVAADFLTQSTSTNLMQDFKPRGICFYMFHNYVSSSIPQPSYYCSKH